MNSTNLAIGCMTFATIFSTTIFAILMHNHPDIKIEPLSMIVSNFISGMLGYISGYYMGKDVTTTTTMTETPETLGTKTPGTNITPEKLGTKTPGTTTTAITTVDKTG